MGITLTPAKEGKEQTKILETKNIVFLFCFVLFFGFPTRKVGVSSFLLPSTQICVGPKEKRFGSTVGEKIMGIVGGLFSTM